MQRDGFQRAERLFHEALALTPAGREHYIHEQAGADTDLASRVKRMIEFAERPSATEGLLADATDPNDADRDDNSALIGATLGPYHLTDVIGRGGFGVVYRGEQVQPIRRTVAVKILRGGMDSQQVIARFEGERHTLALMEHPNIARVLDAGRTPPNLGQRPYFVMELVGGKPITEFCDARRLNAEARLELFIAVCEAVQHAHQKGIIHRDLKPSNILVAESNGTPTPKVIDFGIAKALERRPTERTLVTEAQQLLGTPQYMSPEQADMQIGGVDTRSDIYSLGVILYELLTGTTPLDAAALRDASFSQMQKMIQSEVIERPSTRVTRSGGEAAALIAQQRDANIASLRKCLRGDLDWITLKALEHDRERRYSSASALADDIRRHQRHEPVQAGPPTAAYRIRKFVRRNRLGVVAASLIGLALIGGAVGTTIGMLRARDSAAQALSVNDFMRGVLTSTNPDNSGADVRLVDVLKTASDTASQRFAGHPELEAQVRDMLGEVYWQLSAWGDAERELRTAMGLWQQLARLDDPRSTETAANLAELFLIQDRGREAENVLNDLMPRIQRTFAPDHAQHMRVSVQQARVDIALGRIETGERRLRDLRARVDSTADNDLLHLNIVDTLIVALRHRQPNAEGVERDQVHAELMLLARESIERNTRLFGAHSVHTLDAKLSLAELALQGERPQEAAGICREILEVSKDRLVDCHPLRQNTMLMLATALNALGDTTEPADLALSVIECLGQRVGSDHPVLLGVQNEVLTYFERAGRWADGERLARELSDRLTRLGGGTHGDLAFNSDMYLARFLSMQDRHEEARLMFESLFNRVPDSALEYSARPQLHLFYGCHLTRIGEFEQAQQQLDSGMQFYEGNGARNWNSITESLVAACLELYTAWGKPEKVAEYQRLQHEHAGATTMPQ